jgi:hypothetical protein
MTFLPPFVVHGTHGLDAAGISAAAADYRRAIESLRDGRIDLDAAQRHPRLNASLDAIIRT